MLNSIKDMIKQKKLFQEAAELLLEDEQLDDSILLNEEPMIPETFTEDDDEPSLPEVDDEEHDDDEPEKEDNDSEKDSDDDDDDKDDDGEKPEEKPDESDEDDIMNAPMSDDLPEPVSAATQEPISSDDTANILSMEIDLATNTPTDVLPTPPASAVDALEGEDDILSQRVDSGFGRESSDTYEAGKINFADNLGTNVSKEDKEKINKIVADGIKNKIKNAPTSSLSILDDDSSSDAPKNESFDLLDSEDDEEFTESNQFAGMTFKDLYTKAKDIMNKISKKLKNVVKMEAFEEFEDLELLEEKAAMTESRYNALVARADALEKKYRDIKKELRPIIKEYKNSGISIAIMLLDNMIRMYRSTTRSVANASLEDKIKAMNDLAIDGNNLGPSTPDATIVGVKRIKSIKPNTDVDTKWISLNDSNALEMMIYLLTDICKVGKALINADKAGVLKDSLANDVITDKGSEWLKNNPHPWRSVKESGDLLSEAITIGGSDDSSSDVPDADMGSGTPKDNTVTSAVKDKLNEINSDDQPAEEPELFPDDDSSTDDNSSDNSSDGAPVDKAELLKKLSKLTNGIEDAKMAVMKAIK